MCLRTKLTGPGLEDLVITKTINVQQNPGRGAKVSHFIFRGFENEKAVVRPPYNNLLKVVQVVFRLM